MAYTQTCCSVCVCGAGGRLFGVCAYGVYFLHVYSPPLYGCELGVWVGLACMYLSHTHTYTRTRVSLGNSRIKGKIFFFVIFFSFFLRGRNARLFAIFVRAFPAQKFAFLLHTHVPTYTHTIRVCVGPSVHVYLFLIWISVCCLAFKWCRKCYAFAFNFTQVINIVVLPWIPSPIPFSFSPSLLRKFTAPAALWKCFGVCMCDLVAQC